jgi:hypothetical protein
MCVLSIRSSKIGHYKTKWEFKENSSSKTGPAKRMKEKRAKLFPVKIKKVRKVSFIQADYYFIIVIVTDLCLLFYFTLV